MRNPERSFVLPRIHKFLLPASEHDLVLDELVCKLREGDYTPALGGGPFHDLADGQTLTPSVLPPDSDTRDWELQVLQCLGHTVDSVCLVFPADRSLFMGDSVLGQGTARF
jgi:glyoxylase-like metal-dependent hydrolase (beta-lactamase superfamily II)